MVLAGAWTHPYLEIVRTGRIAPFCTAMLLAAPTTRGAEAQCPDGAPPPLVRTSDIYVEANAQYQVAGVPQVLPTVSSYFETMGS
ncbi:MAG: hypothetical protein JWM95_1946 [Gemmatimonadetes bacterium]|nr:hypothetical protein [Gemmatimonadota bacterium]